MIARTVSFYLRLFDLFACGKTVARGEIRDDYNRISQTYDESFSSYVAKHSLGLIKAMDLPRGARALDLACGTGTLTLAIADAVGENGEVIGVDQSPGMIAVAESKRSQSGAAKVNFIEGDMSEVLDSFDAGSFDAITCGWAIGYVRPKRLLSSVKRILKRGGKVGLIENRRDTLEPVYKTSMRVAQRFFRQMRQVMDLHLRLPRSMRHIRKWFRGAKLRPLDTWQGKEEFAFRSGSDVLNWVLSTGASAGFDKVMSPEIKAECDACFVKYIERDFSKGGWIDVSHRFVAGIARKEDGPCI